MNISRENLARLASLYAGLVFGVYWIPLRALESAGFKGVWAAVVFSAVPMTLLLPLALYRRRRLLPAVARFHAGSLAVGLAVTLYASAFVYTEVVRAILLFYMTPIWGFLLARWVIGDLITPLRWLSIVLGVTGLLVILGVDSGLPLPKNGGDWMALGAGFIWAVGSLLLLTDRHSNPIDYGIGFFFWAAVSAASIAVLATLAGLLPVPHWQAVSGVLPWMLPLALLVLIPGGFATVYGPTVLNPGIVGLLFMTEISVATITAALLAGEPFGWRELAGVALITSAGLLEPVVELLRARS